MKKIQDEAKQLLSLLEEIKIKAESNNACPLLSKINKLILAKTVLPYLDIKDLINMRSTCKEINLTISSSIAIVAYIKNIQGKKANQQIINTSLTSFSEITDFEDVQMQMQNLKNINEFLAKKIFKAEAFIKVCKTDMDFLKKELHSHSQLSTQLSEDLISTRMELENARRENSVLAQNYQEASKKLKESTSILTQENEQLVAKNDKLAYEIESLHHTIFKLTKVKDELEVKNVEKANALKSIRNFFLTSNLFKIKNISDLEKEYEERRKS